MDMDTYQHLARETAIYPEKFSQVYPLLGLSGEVGEFCNKYKKVLRDHTTFSTADAKAEMGDILWYLANLATDFGITLESIAEDNIEKLQDRQVRGVLGGSGDNR